MLEFYVYELKGTVFEEDWFGKITPGILKPTVKVIKTVVVDDPSDTLCINGYGKDGKHYQFDSDEAYCAASYFSREFEKHGLFIETYKVSIPNEDLIRFRVE